MANCPIHRVRTSLEQEAYARLRAVAGLWRRDRHPQVECSRIRVSSIGIVRTRRNTLRLLKFNLRGLEGIQSSAPLGIEAKTPGIGVTRGLTPSITVARRARGYTTSPRVRPRSRGKGLTGTGGGAEVAPLSNRNSLVTRFLKASPI